MTSTSENQTYAFDEFRLDTSTRTLSLSGKPVALTAKVLDTLIYLVANQGRVISKDELMREIWSDSIVEENNLNKNISKLRQVIGEKPGEHRYIVTVPGIGYKFVAPITVIDSTAGSPSPGESESEASPAYISDTAAVGLSARINRKHTLWLIGGVLVVTAAFAILYLRGRDTSPVPSTVVPKLAILPFKPLVIGDRDEALETGIAETLIVRLGSGNDLVVRPLGSVRKFAGVDQDAQEAGRQLGVDMILDGSVQHSGNQIRVIVRLINVSTGNVSWNATYDEELTNIFSVQDRIASRVADALKLKLDQGQKAALVKHQTENPEAYRLYIQGRYFVQKITPSEVRRGIGFLQRAIDSDPTYALAYAGISDAYRSLPINGDIPSDEAMPKARAAAARALEIDPDLADGHIALGYVFFWFDHNWKAAEVEFQTAIQSNPNNADARRAYSVLLTCLGRHPEAFDQMRIARELDPLSLITAALEGQTLLLAGKYDEAIAAVNHALELDPNFWVAHIQLARIYIQQGHYESAILEAEKARSASDGNSEAISLAGYAAALSGNSERATEALRELKRMASRGFATDYNSAMTLNGLGKHDEALSALQNAVSRRDVRLILLKVDPKWENLRMDPRFAEIMRQINF